jgi:DNA-binding NarL/FixJ family response regulator
MKERIRVLLVDRDQSALYRIRAALEEQSDLEVVADCTAADQALALVQSRRPDIVMMDIQMPDRAGIEATRLLKTNGLDTQVGVIILAKHPDYAIMAMEAGAEGYVLKDVGDPDLVESVRQVYWNMQSPDEDDPLAEEVELLISHADDAQLIRFIGGAQSFFDANLVKAIEPRTSGTTITLMVRTSVATSLIDNLSSIPTVERVQPVSEGRTPGHLDRPGILAKPVGHRTRLLVDLGQHDSTAKREPVAV